MTTLPSVTRFPFAAGAAKRSRTTAPHFRALLLLVLLVGAGPLVGCARYEYDIVAPLEMAQHIGTKQWATVDRDPLEYRFTTVESRLVMQIHNRSADPIQLSGDRSVAVAPRGQSHGLVSQTIAPDSFVKLILPPMPAQVRRTGPSFGFGVGLGIGSAGYRRYPGYHGGLGYHDPFWDEPRYYAVYDPNNNTYWEWTGEGEARLTLVFERGGGGGRGDADGDRTFTHQFTFARRKV